MVRSAPRPCLHLGLDPCAGVGCVAQCFLQNSAKRAEHGKTPWNLVSMADWTSLSTVIGWALRMSIGGFRGHALTVVSEINLATAAQLTSCDSRYRCARWCRNARQSPFFPIGVGFRCHPVTTAVRLVR